MFKEYVLVILLLYTIYVKIPCCYTIKKNESCDLIILIWNTISGIMVGVLALSVVDYGFNPWSNHTKDYEISIC
jgi:hypothetical protein